MKTLIIILFFTVQFTFSQNFEIKGNSVVNNKGKINVKRRNVNIEENANVNNSGTITIEDRTLNSEGNINNTNGKLILNYQGGTVLSQQEIKGYVEFVHQNNQFIPAVLFDSVVFNGGTKFLRPNIRTNRIDFGVSSFFQSQNSTDIRVEDPDDLGIPKLYSHKNTDHNGTVNRNGSTGIEFILFTDSTFSQINGTGSFKNLELDKENGSTITRGGWKVEKKLTLRNGVLYNSNDQNFTLEDGSVIDIVDGNFAIVDEAGITRYPQSRLNMAPNFEGKINVHYTGEGEIEIGPEMPRENDILNILIVENTEGTTFTRDAYVNDRLTVGSNIYMDSDSDGDGINDKQNTLYYTAENLGIDFENQGAEIIGNFARTNLSSDANQTFNNAFTWVEFRNEGNDLSNNGGQIDTFQVRIEPNTFYDENNYGGEEVFEKVKRKILLTAKDENGNDITDVNDVRLGYAWRHDDNLSEPINETPDNIDVPFNEMILKRWSTDTEFWEEQLNASTPIKVPAAQFAYANANLDGKLGEFSIGLTIARFLNLMAKAVMEGAYSGGDTMRTTLQDSLILPNTPPAEYPYNLDPFRDEIIVENFPEGVVDWIVLEFRDGGELASETKYYKTCFLTKNGTIVDTNGSSQIQMSSEKTGINAKGGGNYYLAIRHRNHLTVVTKNPIPSSSREATEIVDFSDPEFVYGGASQLKVLGIDSQGNRINGLVAGNVERISTFTDPLTSINTGEQYIGVEDVDFIAPFLGYWDLNPKNRYLRSDVNLDGIITVRDYNISWNNRGRISLIE